MDHLLSLFQDEPIGAFALLLAVSLLVPPIFERLRLPGVLGLLTAGVCLGPNGLGLLSVEAPSIKLLADIGLLYLMFVAGLEIDLEQLRQVKHRSAGFGALTFSIPLMTGVVIGRLFHFDWNGSILLGSLLASHSLMTYPIVRRLGVVANEAVTVTIGATIITDIGALIVLAICLGIHGGGFGVTKLLTLLLLLALYTTVVLVGLDRIGRDFFRRSGSDEGNQFLFLLLAVFVAALGAQLIGVEKIVGAFLSGLAVNDVVGDGPVKEKVVFVGSVLFIPIFFVNIGLLIDLPAFISSLSSFWLALAIVVGLIGSKFVAALCAKFSFGYNWREMITMWGMSMPQVATTLAATLVGNRVGLLSDAVLNSVVVMMLVTATLGPIMVARAAAGLSVASPNLPPLLEDERLDLPQPHSYTVIIPIYNPATEQYLVELAALIAQHQNGQIVPLAIALARPHMKRQHLVKAMSRTQLLLTKAESLGQSFRVPVKPLLRIDDQVPLGIYRASQEQWADLIIMGWSNTTSLKARLFGNIVDSVFEAAPCRVLVAQLKTSPREMSRLLIPVENFSARSLEMVALGLQVAQAIAAEVTLLHVVPPSLSDDLTDWAQQKLAVLASPPNTALAISSKIVQDDDLGRAILREAQAFPLLILHSQRQQVAAEGFGYSSITSQLIRQFEGSTLVVGDVPDH